MGDGGQRRRGFWEGMDTGSQAAGGEAEGDEDGTAPTSWHKVLSWGHRVRPHTGSLNPPAWSLASFLFGGRGGLSWLLSQACEQRGGGEDERPPGHRKPFIHFFFF